MLALGVAGGVVAATVAVLVPPGAGASSTSRCRARDLAGAIIDVQGAAGTRSGRLILVNKSSTSCRIKGFVGVRLVGTNGVPLPTHVNHLRGTPVRTVVIRSGAAGALTIRWNVIPSGSTACATAEWLRVSPPGDTHTVRVFFGDTACRGQVAVGPVTNPATV
jgi:hypothetical protein